MSEAAVDTLIGLMRSCALIAIGIAIGAALDSALRSK